MTTVFDFGAGPVSAYRHPSGGGWVAETASVHPSAYIGPDAQVFDYATVSANVSVLGNAKVYNFAQVTDTALVSDNAEVFGDCIIQNSAAVYDNAKVHGHAVIGEYARIYGNANVCGTLLYVGGCANILGNTILKADGDVVGSTWIETRK